ncbi:MAG: TIGR03960 family B12-binding radical SAM protein [Bacillota bacterium]|jgi:radical SAM family uncharacterized protein
MNKKNYKSWTKEVEEQLLPNIEKPGQYLGNEFNTIEKNLDEVQAAFAFCFPDTYEIGMSHLGLRVLYEVTNKDPRFALERSFAPQTDMENLMREKGIPLFTWENYHAVKDFDFVGFTLQYEMSFSNILNMLDLAGLPVYAKDRAHLDDMPVVVAGGPCAYNPEPLADFIDIFIMGEGEEVNLEMMECWVKVRDEAGGNTAAARQRFLEEVCKIEGIYVPKFYTPCWDETGKLTGMETAEHAPRIIKKRLIKDLENVGFPVRPIVPFTQIIHDRVVLEVMRGCNRGCRFCQAGIIYRPVREKSVEVLRRQAREAVKCSGYDEIGMISLSTADYSCVEDLIDQLMADSKGDGVSVSLPSLRVDAFSVDLAKRVQQVRKSGLTFAPEAGTQRMRDIINKGVQEEDIVAAVSSALANGWHNIKLYFMAGLPFETEEDLDGIFELTKKIIRIGKEMNAGKGNGKPINVTVSVAFFVPKAHTPFQWFGQVQRDELLAKRDYLYNKFKPLKNARLNCHGVDLGFLEGCFARGDRRLCAVLYEAWKSGCKFDGWSEHFSYDKWLKAFAKVGLDPVDFANHAFEKGDVLPWDHISVGVSKKWLWREWERAEQGVVTPNCRQDKCSGCGVCGAMDCGSLYQKPYAVVKGEKNAD